MHAHLQKPNASPHASIMVLWKSMIGWSQVKSIN